MLPSLPSTPTKSTLAQRAFHVVVIELLHGRYTRSDLERLPFEVLHEVQKAAKGANLLDNSSVDLFFGPLSTDFVLSGASCFTSVLPSAFPQHLANVQLYNCSALTEAHIDAIFEHCAVVVELNLGRLKALRDRHVEVLPRKAPNVKLLVLNRNPQLSDTCLRALAALPHLQELSLFGCTGLKAPAPFVGDCVALETLSISKVSGFGGQWKHLCRCTRMQSLVAQRVPITLKDLRMVLAAWPRLRKLDLLPAAGLKPADFTAAVLEYNIELSWLAMPGSIEMLPVIRPHLRVLNLAKNVLIPAPLLLEALRGCEQLEEFALLRPARGSVSDDLVRHLLSLKSLRQLYLSGAEALTDAPFVDLEPQSSSLEIFELAQVPIGPAALESIAEACPRLRQLNLSGNNAALGSSTAMEAVGRHCGSLRSLNASGSIMVRAPWGDATVYALLSHSNLIMLKLINCSYSTLTAEGCVTLLRCLPRLKILDVTRTLVHESAPVSRLPDVLLLSSLAYDHNADAVAFLDLLLSHMPVLSTLSARGVTDVGSCFDDFSNRMVSLKVSECGVTAAQLLVLTERCPRLHLLNLCSNPDIDDASVRVLLERCRALQTLHVGACRQLSDAAFDVPPGTGVGDALELVDTTDTNICNIKARFPAVQWVCAAAAKPAAAQPLPKKAKAAPPPSRQGWETTATAVAAAAVLLVLAAAWWRRRGQ